MQTDLAALRREVRFLRVLVFVALAVACIAAVKPQPEQLTVSGLRVVDESGQEVATLLVDDDEPVLTMKQDGKVSRLHAAGLTMSDGTTSTSVSRDGVGIVRGKVNAVMGVGEHVGLFATGGSDGRTIWISPQQ